MQDRRWWLTMALSGALVVILGALAAHALKGLLEPRFENAFITGVRYQAWHTFAAMALLAWRAQHARPFQHQTLMLWCFGTLLFSGSLYLLALAALANTSLGAFGIVTPIGGAILIAGWLRLAWGIFRQR
ncbi:DUF423 domain-containing protein [Halomonas huangheensis]|uniref:DUF423 domain-containing protein n=1 Tax=Halomonas huangheensis TaxID=1178482 RepID=W1N8K9_9GAMM|nr:DUF423 domain-containing protein [Halomonas huangheensis]ALM50989.1 hypothetical protein AR456_00775 [Halomonas huangheensis]ERL51270.1 hypothetical protein BJB45_15315 [Halomonas huangheensis]